jgi:hypothetical protein
VGFVFWGLTRFCVDYVELILKEHDPIVPRIFGSTKANHYVGLLADGRK